MDARTHTHACTHAHAVLTRLGPPSPQNSWEQNLKGQNKTHQDLQDNTVTCVPVSWI